MKYLISKRLSLMKYCKIIKQLLGEPKTFYLAQPVNLSNGTHNWAVLLTFMVKTGVINIVAIVYRASWPKRERLEVIGKKQPVVLKCWDMLKPF